MRFFQKINKEAHLRQSIPHGHLKKKVKEIIFINFITIIINQSQIKIYLRHTIFCDYNEIVISMSNKRD